MFELEQTAIEKEIQQVLQQNELPEMEIRWAWIPFNGQWGISTSFFQLASKSFGADKGNVAQRAREIAEKVAAALAIPEGISKIEAVNGYLNITFSPSIYSQRVVDEVLAKGDAYGKGRSERKTGHVRVLATQYAQGFPRRPPAQRFFGRCALPHHRSCRLMMWCGLIIRVISVCM